MMTSWNGNIFRVTGPLCGEFTGPSEFPTQRSVTWSFDVFFDLCLNKRLSKQPWDWWFEMPLWSLWRHCNVAMIQLMFMGCDTGISIVYSMVCSGTDQRKHQSSMSLVFLRPIHRWPVNSQQKGPVTQKIFPIDDVIMWICILRTQSLNSSSPGQNVWRLTNIFKCIFMNEKSSILIRISLNFVPKSPTDNNPVLD